MKKSLLLFGALIAGAFVSNAQDTVEPTAFVQRDEVKPQSIPGWLTLGDCKITVWQGETAAKEVYTANDAKAEFNGVSEAPTLGNINNNYVVEYNVVSTAESYYVLTTYVGSKNDGGSIELELINGENAVWSGVIAVPNTGNWSSRSWAAPYAIVDEEIPAGSYTLRMTFKQEDPTLNVVNVAGIQFEEYATVPQQCEIYPTLELLVGEDEYDAGEDAGTIVVSPSMEKYISGTELTVTAQAKVGYRFLYYYLNNDTDAKVYENPYIFSIDEDTDISAVFEKLDMNNVIPGQIDLLKAIQDPSNVASGKSWNVTASCKVDGTAQDVTYLSDFRSPCEVQYNLDVKVAGEYTIEFGYGTKKTPTVEFKIEDAEGTETPVVVTMSDFTATSSWSAFTTTETEKFNLTAGKKILTITCSDPGAKETINLCNITFVTDAQSGIEDIVVSEEIEEVNAYNLQGIKVAPDTKGLLIINGKKVYNQ